MNKELRNNETDIFVHTVKELIDSGKIQLPDVLGAMNMAVGQLLTDQHHAMIYAHHKMVIEHLEIRDLSEDFDTYINALTTDSMNLKLAIYSKVGPEGVLK